MNVQKQNCIKYLEKEEVADMCGCLANQQLAIRTIYRSQFDISSLSPRLYSYRQQFEV